jgi:hypothetical protein
VETGLLSAAVLRYIKHRAEGIGRKRIVTGTFHFRTALLEVGGKVPVLQLVEFTDTDTKH